MSLPIDLVLPDLLQALRERPAVVLQAPPGAGKTTRVPLALLTEPWLADRRIIMLEPRRLAARAAARFMASLLGEEVGQRVGYRTRLDSKIGPNTRIEVVTEGILTRMLQDDPALEPYGAVLFDEFHERSLQADLGLALTLETMQALREDLRLVVMSATLDAEPVARLMNNAPVVTSSGRSFPVELRYAPPRQGEWERHLAALIPHLMREESGSVLVFLPGAGEIRRLESALEGQVGADVRIAPLYGDLSREAQDLAIQPAPAGQRKLVLATSIAETSLTIEGIRIVVDAGLQRVPVFDPVTGLSRLQTVRVSRAAAEQRSGRAGRIEAGVCYRLWSEAEQERLVPFLAPEILSADLSDLVLELAQWGVRDPDQLAWLDPPPRAAWDQARELLQRLRVLDEAGGITDHGRRVGRLGLHPRLAHMVIKAAELGWARLAAEVAALLSEADIMSAARHTDIQARLMLLRGEMQAQGVERARVQRVRQTARQILQRLGAYKEQLETFDSAGVVLAFAYPDRVAKRRGGGAARYLLANGRGAVLREDDPLHDVPYLVAATLDNEGREARIFLAGALSQAAIETYLAEDLEEEDAVFWDADAEVVRAQRQTRYGRLVLQERPLASPDPMAITEALRTALCKRNLVDLPWTKEARHWQARVTFLRNLEGEIWPDVSDEALASSSEQWLLPFAPGYRRLAQFKDFPLRQALDSLLSYEQQRQLERKAPEWIEVPSGSRISLDYESGEVPILAVRLQEMFGLTQTPAIAEGKVPLMLHLLSPSRRPVQVTRDLASFWRHAYLDVRKDLRGRYPKHHWPDDPLTAQATRHTKPRSG